MRSRRGFTAWNHFVLSSRSAFTGSTQSSSSSMQGRGEVEEEDITKVMGNGVNVNLLIFSPLLRLISES